ncbi:MAG TPA: SRPBCC family protein [Caulobacteraceae bacterium]|nr:SRPBCC family protein [Caulobacteraceae bacterium]
MHQTEQKSTDANVHPTAFIGEADEAGPHDANSIRAVTIGRPRQELYAFWRDFRNLPRFMENVKSIELLESGRSRWVVAGPGGKDVEWVSVVTEDVPGERIAWRAEAGGDIDHEGWIEFRDAPPRRGTEVRVFISYDPPAGTVGKLVAKVMQREPRVQARRELRRFKQLMETGEVTTSKAPDAAPRA